MTSGERLTDADRARVLELNATRLYSRRQIAIKSGLHRHTVAQIIDDWAAMSWRRATRDARLEDLASREP